MRNISRVVCRANQVIDGTFLQAVTGRVAEVLLDYVVDDRAEKPGLSQREMALQTGASWEQVHKALENLQKEGAIRIERNRIMIDEVKLRRMAGIACGACWARC